MPESSLAKKMKLKPGARAGIIGAPADYLSELEPLPDKVQVFEKLDPSGQFDWIQLFVKTQAEMEAQLKLALPALKPESMLWISFPKGTSKIQTDLTRDKGWDILKTVDLKWVNLVSVNDTWSAFALRPYKPGEARQEFR
jgi:hypothetical protein